MFSHGVWSGDCTADSITVGTRIAAWAGGSMLLEVSGTPDMGVVVYQQQIPADQFGGNRDYTYKATVGGLQPTTWYYYRFTYQGEQSDVGSTRTTPNLSANPPRVRIVVLTCQHWQEGYWQVLEHAAGQGADMVIHSGDFIYENVIDNPLPGREMTLPDGLPIDGAEVPSTLAGYRHIYRTYRADPALRALSAAAPWWHTWDDHEFANDYYWQAAYNAHISPTSPLKNNPSDMRQLHADAVQAFYEYTPTRNGQPLYRSVRWGQLADIFVLDCRTYRSPHPCGETYRQRVYTAGCPQMTDPSQTMLGAEQLAWLLDGLQSSTARYKVLVSPVMVSDIWIPGPDTLRLLKLDGWSGYQYERQLILDAAPAGTVALSGDLHAALCGILRRSDGTVAAKEVGTPAVSSLGIGPELLNYLGMDEATHQAVVRGHNPDMVYFNGYTNGYVLVDLYPNYGQASLYLCDAREQNSAPTLAQVWQFNGGAT